MGRRAFVGGGLCAALGTVACGGDDEGATPLGTATVGDDSGDTGSSGEGADEGSSGGEGNESSSGGPQPVDFDPDAVAEDIGLFPRTVMSGEMQPTSVMLAIYVDDRMPKTLRVWLPSDVAGQVELVDEREVVPDPQGFVKTTVQGLTPGTWYRYAFFSGAPDSGFSGRSLIGEVRTAIGSEVEEPVTIAIAACNGGYVDPANPEPFFWDTMTALGGEYFDAFIHLGDQAYMDDVFEAGGSYEQYLEAWGAYHGGGYRDVYPLAGLYCTWDDHEVTDNGAVEPWTREVQDIERLENAIRAFYRVLPIEGAESTDRLWRSFQWGRTVEFIILDSRYERSPEKQGNYVSPEQLDFLKRRLSESPCRFKVICNSVPFTDLSEGFGSIAADDRWQGYPAQRQEIIDFVDDNAIENVYFITGDIHVNFVADVEVMPGAGPGSRMKEIGVTAGNSNPVASLLSGAQYSYVTADPRSVLVTFDPSDSTVHVRFIDPTSGEIDHEEVLRPPPS